MMRVVVVLLAATVCLLSCETRPYIDNKVQVDNPLRYKVKKTYNIDCSTFTTGIRHDVSGNGRYYFYESQCQSGLISKRDEREWLNVLDLETGRIVERVLVRPDDEPSAQSNQPYTYQTPDGAIIAHERSRTRAGFGLDICMWHWSDAKRELSPRACLNQEGSDSRRGQYYAISPSGKHVAVAHHYGDEEGAVRIGLYRYTPENTSNAFMLLGTYKVAPNDLFSEKEHYSARDLVFKSEMAIGFTFSVGQIPHTDIVSYYGWVSFEDLRAPTSGVEAIGRECVTYINDRGEAVQHPSVKYTDQGCSYTIRDNRTGEVLHHFHLPHHRQYSVPGGSERVRISRYRGGTAVMLYSAHGSYGLVWPKPPLHLDIGTRRFRCLDLAYCHRVLPRDKEARSVMWRQGNKVRIGQLIY